MIRHKVALIASAIGEAVALVLSLWHASDPESRVYFLIGLICATAFVALLSYEFFKGRRR